MVFLVRYRYVGREDVPGERCRERAFDLAKKRRDRLR